MASELAAACLDGSVRLRDVATEVWAGILHGHTGTVYDVAYSPDGRRRIITGSLDETVRVWDHSSRSSIHVLRGHGSFVRAVAFDPEGRRIASASEDNAVRIWDAAAGKEIGVLRGHAAFVTDVAFSPDGRRIASASEDGTVKLWDTTAAEPLHCDLSFRLGVPLGLLAGRHIPRHGVPRQGPDLGRHELPGRSVSPMTGATRGQAWSSAPTGRRIAWTKSGPQSRCGTLATGRPPWTLGGHLAQPLGLAFHPDGRQLASTFRLGRHRPAVGCRDRCGGPHCSAGPRASIFAAACSPGMARGSPWPSQMERPRDLVPRPTAGRSGATICENIGRPSPGWRRMEWPSAPTAGGWPRAAILRIGRRARCGSSTWTTGRRIFTLRGHTSNVTSVAFSPDGRRIATSSFDRTVKLWEPRSSARRSSRSARSYQRCAWRRVQSRRPTSWPTGSIDSTAKVRGHGAHHGEPARLLKVRRGDLTRNFAFRRVFPGSRCCLLFRKKTTTRWSLRAVEAKQRRGSTKRAADPAVVVRRQERPSFTFDASIDPTHHQGRTTCWSSSRKGFTLIELLVVIAIISV